MKNKRIHKIMKTIQKIQNHTTNTNQTQNVNNHTTNDKNTFKEGQKPNNKLQKHYKQ